ncbi:uncharacterized protein NEMAJ01_0546 [Nematocida major]|uniref:uncharacterized protein n=1 Tax=Nematocida major TaxID=1912982 RepID=UPI0020086CC6|nr:uncharacterized protein NEMAJ01_0546 [Nematocida major]KAH9385650.1 hypothetical protein NEMAJ01_0546 [Nematocida major]
MRYSITTENNIYTRITVEDSSVKPVHYEHSKACTFIGQEDDDAFRGLFTVPFRIIRIDAWIRRNWPVIRSALILFTGILIHFLGFYTRIERMISLYILLNVVLIDRDKLKSAILGDDESPETAK